MWLVASSSQSRRRSASRRSVTRSLVATATQTSGSHRPGSPPTPNSNPVKSRAPGPVGPTGAHDARSPLYTRPRAAAPSAVPLVASKHSPRARSHLRPNRLPSPRDGRRIRRAVSFTRPPVRVRRRRSSRGDELGAGSRRGVRRRRRGRVRRRAPRLRLRRPRAAGRREVRRPAPLAAAPRRRGPRGSGVEGEASRRRRQQVRAAVRRAALHRDARHGAPLNTARARLPVVIRAMIRRSIVGGV